MIDTGLQNLSLHDHKKTSTPLSAKPPTAAAASPPAPPQHRPDGAASHSHASRPQQHGPEVLHGPNDQLTARASCRRSRWFGAREAGQLGPRQGIMFVASLCTWHWLAPSFTSQAPHKGRDLTGYWAHRPATRDVLFCCVLLCVVVCCFCCVLLLLLLCVVVESKKITVRGADLSDLFVDKMCVFVSRPMKIATFLRKKKVTTQNGLLIFLGK